MSVWNVPVQRLLTCTYTCSWLFISRLHISCLKYTVHITSITRMWSWALGSKLTLVSEGRLEIDITPVWKYIPYKNQEIIYGRGKFVGDFNMDNIICVKILPRASASGEICADNVTHIKISNKLTPSANYFYSNRTYTVNF